jgi:hypothetical protein
VSRTYYPESSSHAVIDYYEIEVKDCEKQIYPDRPPTKYVGYDGQVPGPKFVMQQGRGKFEQVHNGLEAIN